MDTAAGSDTRWRPLLVWVVAGLVLASCRLPSFELWGDVRYTLGVERVTAAAGWPSWQVWTHRPLLNRVLMAGLDHLTAGRYREQQILGWSSAAASVAVGALHATLVPRIGPAAAAGLCGGLLVGLVWTPPRTLLQPEWYALVLAVAAVAVAGLGLRGRRGEWLLAAGAGALLTAAVLMKWTTVGTAAAAWTVVALLSWRQPQRLLRVTALTAVLVPSALALEVLLVPQELLWIREIPRLNPPAEAMRWCTPSAAPQMECRAQMVLLNETLTSPLLLFLPAAMVTLLRTSAASGRVAAVVVPVVTVMSAWATTAVQGQWFSYHLSAVPVLAAGYMGWAAGTVVHERGRPRWSGMLLVGAVGVADASLLSLPARVRTGHSPVWLGLDAVDLAYGLALGVAAGALLLALASQRLRGAEPPRATGRLRAFFLVTPVVLVMAGQIEAVLPQTAYSLNTQSADVTATALHAQRRRQVALASRVHARIGTSPTVVYLGFGDRGYWLGNPSRCRYAAATYLQRSGYLPAGKLRGFEQNLDCLADPGTAYVLIQKGWVDLAHADPRVQQAVDANFDCRRPAISEPNLLVCPRRESARRSTYWVSTR